MQLNPYVTSGVHFCAILFLFCIEIKLKSVEYISIDFNAKRKQDGTETYSESAKGFIYNNCITCSIK